MTFEVMETIVDQNCMRDGTIHQLPFQYRVSRNHEVLVRDDAQEELESTTLNKVRLELHAG